MAVVPDGQAYVAKDGARRLRAHILVLRRERVDGRRDDLNPVLSSGVHISRAGEYANVSLLKVRVDEVPGSVDMLVRLLRVNVRAPNNRSEERRVGKEC